MTPQPETGAAFVDAIIASDPDEARRVQDGIEQALRERRVAEPEIFGIKLAVEEALINAIKHGNQMDRAKKVRVAYRLTHDRFEVKVTDEGPGFEPNEVPDPTDVENLDRPCGRGLMLMRHYMTEVTFRGPGNSVSMAKVFRNGKK